MGGVEHPPSKIGLMGQSKLKPYSSHLKGALNADNVYMELLQVIFIPKGRNEEQ